MWEFEFGDLADGKWVLHKCDNRKCVNPTHLFLGTHDDNMRDMVNKGRSLSRKGFTNPNARLTADQITRIRELRADGWFYNEIAKHIGCGYGTVGRICRFETGHEA